MQHSLHNRLVVGELRQPLCSNHRFFVAVVLRPRPTLILASRVLPSMPPLFHRAERHFLRGQFGGFSVSGIHRCPHASHAAANSRGAQATEGYVGAGDVVGSRPATAFSLTTADATRRTAVR